MGKCYRNYKEKNLDNFDESKIYEKNASSFEKIQDHKNIFEYKNLIEIKTDAFFVKFNKNKGLSIFLCWLNKRRKRILYFRNIRTWFFDNIELGADFSGAFVMQDMKDANLVTDLVKVDPVVSYKNEVIALSTDFKIGKAIVKNYFYQFKNEH